ncbi:LIM domain-containing protein isoform X1 [Tachysurus fulvidraco]|uniref:LIM domain-containing protein isoform X1 n=1 Tax=Tachysurus fulvidraco TaxID=1234273 RepID=UPI001FF02FFC|nr:LIM domain-containing protein isoform X1 [Tachysurus fulvidraco]XP_047664617.1 LIM domain-containing protein isoform X1 [Tachysurus fulvidraco]
METNLRKTQSLRCVATDHALPWTEAGLRDKKKSVWQLVAQYQNAVAGKTKAADSAENKQKTLQFAAIPITVINTKEKSNAWADRSTSTQLTRSKSMDYLPRQRTISTSALREIFESKVAMKPKSVNKPKNTDKPQSTSGKENVGLNHNNTEDLLVLIEADSINNNDEDGEKSAKPTKEKENNVTPKMAKAPRVERRKTLTGVNSERIVTQSEDKRKSVADFRDSSALYGREKSPISVKAISELYLSKVAAAESTGNLLKPKKDCTSPTRPKVFKMADVTPKDFEQAPYSEDESAHPDPSFPMPRLNSRADRQSPIPTPPSKEVISTLYEQRQKCELRRLLKHTCPEMKGLGNMVEEEFADILNSGNATDIAFQGEVQSRRRIFENGTVNTEDFQKQTHLMEKSIQGEHAFEELLKCFKEEGSIDGNKQQTIHPEIDETPQKVEESLSEDENFRVNVKAKRKMFEGQFIETSGEDLEDVYPGRIVISEDEKGAVQKQKRDFETYQPGTIKRNSDLSVIDIKDIDQDSGEVYIGISRAKEVFEKGFDYENSQQSNENICIEDETLKTNVKNRTHMFESTPLDRINFQNDAELDSVDKNMKNSLNSLYCFNVIHSHGVLLETSEAGHVRKANYRNVQEKGPEIQHEEVLMGSMKSILLQLLARVNLNPVIAFLKEDDQRNALIKNVNIPTHQLPFTVNQDKEYRTTNMVQAIEDLLGQETCLGKGVLIQERATGSVETLVYVLFRHEGNLMAQNSENILEPKEINLLRSRTCESPHNMCSPPPFTEGNVSISVSHGNRMSNVKQRCIENGDLGHLKSLQKFSSDEDVSATSRQGEQNAVIAPGNVEKFKTMFVSNPELDGSSMQSEIHDQNKLKNNIEMTANGGYTISANGEFENCTVNSVEEPGCRLYSQDGKDMCSKKTDKTIFSPEVQAVDMVEDEALPNLQAAIMSLQQATLEAKALQKSIFEKQHDACLAPSENQNLTGAMDEESRESSQNFEDEQEDEGREETLKGSVQAALDSLKKSSFNVTKGDFKAAMIYRNSGKTHAGQKTIKMETADKQSDDHIVNAEGIKACRPDPLPGQVTVKAQHEAAEIRLFQGQTANKPSECSPLTNQTNEQASLQKSKKSPGPKPAIPPKPDHLKTNYSSKTMAIKTATNAGDLNKPKAEENSVEQQCTKLTHIEPTQEDDFLKEPQNNGDTDIPSSLTVAEIQSSQDCIIMGNPVGNVDTSEKRESSEMLEISEGTLGFQASLQNFGIKTGQAMPPVKPKRIKMTTDRTVVNPALLEPNCKPSISEHEEHPTCNVTMREKKGRRESEEERRQRLSVHMDEIMKGNANAAMEIFDKLRKQEELKTILSKVEEIEGESRQEDGDLRKIFENVPDWVVPQKPIHPKNKVMEKVVGRSETVCEYEMLSSMQVAFGDLEKASAAIITLKEQTLSRLMEIEETIKKALYSVSTLKSDSDIVGLSGLFKESMMTGQYLPFSGNIRKISIGSSKSPNPQSLNNVGVPQKSAMTEPEMQKVEKSKPELSPPEIKPRAGSPSSPSFISIQSTARKNTEITESPKSQTSITALTCYNIPLEKEKRQVSTLEVQTVPKAETVIGTKTIREKYEETDCFGNKFYSSTTSTVMTTQPDDKTSFRRQIVTNPTTTEVVAYPRINTASIKGGQIPS